MSKKALVVDSDFFFVEFLSDLLEKRGYDVLKAYNGKEGIARLEEGPADIVFADLWMPKLDGRQLIQLIRMKYDSDHFPVVALSGTMIEQLNALQDIGADYFIAKGPIDKLKNQLNDFLTEIESKPFEPPSEKKVLATPNVYPRRDAMELIESLQFHQAIIENIGVGVIVVDKDTRVINANSLALEIIEKSAIDVINRKVTQLFPAGNRANLAAALKKVMQQPKHRKVDFFVSFPKKVIHTIVSPILMEQDKIGWLVALADMHLAEEIDES